MIKTIDGEWANIRVWAYAEGVLNSEGVGIPNISGLNEGDNYLVTNVSIWPLAVPATPPAIDGEFEFTFDKDDPTDIELLLDLDGEVPVISGNRINSLGFTLVDSVLTVKKEFLAKLESKTDAYVFTVTTEGGSVDFKITVKGGVTASPKDGDKDGKSNVGLILGLSLGGGAVILGGGFCVYWFLLRKKK